MVITTKITKIFSIMILAAFTSCGTQMQIKDTWHDPNFKGKFKRIYIIGIAKNFKLRERFEQECKKQLREAGIDGVASIDSYSELKNLTKEVIKSEVLAQDADGVLISQMIDYKKKENVVAPQTYGSPGNIGYANYYYAGYYTLHNSGSFTEYKNLTMETKLFDSKTGKPVVSAVSQTSSQEFAIDLITEFGKFIIYRINKAGLLDNRK